MSAPRLHAERFVLVLAGSVLAAFLVLPLYALLLASGSNLAAGLRHPLVWPALRLSLLCASASLVFVVVSGTPLAWLLARARGRLARAIETAVQLPIIVPPAVAGVSLLLAFGRRGVFAGVLFPTGSSLAFSTAAVVMAEAFVSAPFYVQAATAAFRRLDERLITVARTFGASPLRVFARVALPLAAPGLYAGAAMSFARALGEFGATLMFAGNLQGKTQTLPLAIYVALASDLRAAQALSVVLVVVAFALLVGVRALLKRELERAGSRP